MSFAIRMARPEDAPAVRPLLAALGYPDADAAVAARLQALLAAPEAAVLLAEEGAVVGVLALHWTTMLHLPHRVARIGTLVVSEAARGSGIGAALVAAAERLALEKGCTQIELTSGRSRERAHAFYERLGYAWTSLRLAKTLGSGAR